MDHAASLPYVLAKTSFRGKVYMTHPTKAIYKHLMQDSVRVQNTHVSSASAATSGGTDGYVSQLFSEQDVLDTLPQINTIAFHTTHTHHGIKFTPYPAGHVLGACMYLIEIAGLNILFTGDYSREPNRHLIPATVPRNVKVDCLITESTFGINSHNPRNERENRLLSLIRDVVLKRGGRALLPVFALGGAQELLLILEDYWERHQDEMKGIPIYFASSLARRCMVVYQTYIDSMNENIRTKFQQAQLATDGSAKRGPWDFEHVRSLKSLERFEDVGPCVMLASPGMLQNGVSRTLLERWAPSDKNGVIFTGYSVEGTMAASLLKGGIDAFPAVMTNRQTQSGFLGKRVGDAGQQQVMIPRRCTVTEETFAAHVGGDENVAFVKEVGAPVVILVHGEKHTMGRLKSRLVSAGAGAVRVYNPANCEEIRIPFRRDKIARVVGRLANEIHPPAPLPSPPGSDEDDSAAEEDKKKRKLEEDNERVVSGVLVQEDFRLQLMAPEDLKEYAGLSTTTILCRQNLTLAAAGVDLIKWALESAFGPVPVLKDESMHQPHVPPKGEAANGDTALVEHADEEVPRNTMETVLEVMGGAVVVKCRYPGGEVEIEWEGNAENDTVADSVVSVLVGVEGSIGAVKVSSRAHAHEHNHFGDEQGEENGVLEMTKGGEGKFLSAFPDLDLQSHLGVLFLLLEEQFAPTESDPDSVISPLTTPRLPQELLPPAETDQTSQEKALAQAQHSELERLHSLGFPVPGLEIKAGGSVAKLWFGQNEAGLGLEIETGARALKARVQAVVEKVGDGVGWMWG
jgi:cleavage and polyadenylation specificity factor subunit 3